MSVQNAIRMLSIDDKTVTTDLDRAGYRKMGVYVKPAANYEDCTRILQVDTIDIIVINMDYKGIDAVQATKHLKSQPAVKDIPIVLTSVQTAAKVRNSALGAGADLFVEQPLPRQYFIEKLKQLLEQKTRTTERVDLKSEVTINYGNKSLTCPVGDLSVSGMLLATDAKIKDGTAVEVSFEIPGNSKKPIKIVGEVVRTILYSAKFPDRQAGVGVRFTSFLGDSEKRLVTFIEKSTTNGDQMRYYL
jgi:response regulator RpfG family c-di-GMP phosphodiesterase